MDFKGAIFDIDGTLLDSMGVWYQVDVDFFKAYGREMPEDYSTKVAQLGSWRTAEYTIELLGLSKTPEELIDIWNDMVREAYMTTIELKPHAKEYLEYLKSKGVKLAVATALFPDLYVPVLKKHGIYDLFDAFISNGEMKLEKSSPEVYITAANKLDVRPCDCVVFEDIVTGIQGAKAAGMYAVAMADERGSCDRELLEQMADKYIFDFEEMMCNSH